MNGGDLGRFPDSRSALSCASGEPNHHAVRIDESIGGTEAAAENVSRKKLRDAGLDGVAVHHVRLLEAERVLQNLVGAQVFQVRRNGGDEKISLRTIAAGLAEALVELSIELDGVHRHLDVGGGGELGAHSAHAFAGGALALVGLALQDEHVAASLFGEMPGYAGAYDSATHDHHVCRFHV